MLVYRLWTGTSLHSSRKLGALILISIEEAQDLIFRQIRRLEPVRLPLTDALGSALAEDVFSQDDIPPFDNSAMDGFAVRAEDVRGANSASPAVLRLTETIPAGGYSERTTQPGEAVKIMTGAPTPPGADCVVQVEVTEEREGRIFVSDDPGPGANIRRAGEDIEAGDRVLERGDPLGPAEIGLLASVGRAEVEVYAKPRVAIIATGSELVPPGEPLGAGQIRDSNSYTLASLCRQMGLEPERLGVAPDEYQATREMMQAGLEYDVLLTSGGVSVGEFDFVKEVQDDLGVERLLWKVAMKPGKPLVFGRRGDALVFGTPGNPVAVMVAFEVFIRPALFKMMGFARYRRPLHRALLDEDVRNRHGRVHVMRVRAREEADGRWHVRSTGPQGSGILRSMHLANGLIFIPMDRRDMQAGEEVDLMLLREDLV